MWLVVSDMMVTNVIMSSVLFVNILQCSDIVNWETGNAMGGPGGRPPLTKSRGWSWLALFCLKMHKQLCTAGSRWGLRPQTPII